MIWWSDELDVFDSLPLKERLFVRARAFSAPLEALVHRAAGPRVIDAGCGHGVLVALLARKPGLHVTGIDPDARKIDWARQSVGRLPNVSLEVARIEEAAAAAFETVCVADVLYLLPRGQWPSFFEAAFRALVPGGQLLLKEVEDDGSLKAQKALWQERLMVRVLKRTHSSGAIQVARRQDMQEAMQRAGFRVSGVLPLAEGFTTPHVLLVGQKPALPS